jgi:hypothetical protein
LYLFVFIGQVEYSVGSFCISIALVGLLLLLLLLSFLIKPVEMRIFVKSDKGCNVAVERHFRVENGCGVEELKYGMMLVVIRRRIAVFGPQIRFVEWMMVCCILLKILAVWYVIIMVDSKLHVTTMNCFFSPSLCNQRDDILMRLPR